MFYHKMIFMLFFMFCNFGTTFSFMHQVTEDYLVGRYEFSQKECLLEHFSSDFGTMIGSLEHTEEVAVSSSCLPSNGIGTYQLTSSMNISRFRALIKDSSSLSIDLWMQIDDDSPYATEIFTIGSPTASSSASTCDYNMQLLYQASNISIRLCSLVAGVASYSYSDATTIPIFVNKSSIFHMVTSIEFYSDTETVFRY